MIDTPTRPALAQASAFDLRPYQQEALSAIQSADARGVHRQLVSMATGLGKTVIFASLIHQRPGRALVIAHRDELLHQAREKIMMVDPSAKVGIVRAGLDETDANIIVASIQTIARTNRLERLGRDFRTIIIDEAHHATATSYLDVLQSLGALDDDGPLTLGVTATAERGDRVGLGAVFEEIVYEMSILDGMVGGYLADLRAVQVQLATDFSGVRTRAGDFVDRDLAAELVAVDAPDRVARAYCDLAKDRKGLLFAPTVATAEAFADALVDRGIEAEWLSGETPMDERRAILQRLRRGATQVVANCGVLTEGFDEPSIDCIVMARPTKSRPLYVQCVGRGTRKYPGKQDCLVLDLAGVSTRHQLVSAASLFGLDPSELSGARSVMTALEERAGAEEAQRVASERLGEMVAKAVDLFRQRPMNWVQAGATFVLPTKNGRIVLLPTDGRWAVLEYAMNRNSRLLGRDLPLEYAQGVGEDRVRQLGAETLADPRAPWRQRPASEKQVQVLQRRRLWRPGLTAGQASDLITAGVRG